MFEAYANRGGLNTRGYRNSYFPKSIFDLHSHTEEATQLGNARRVESRQGRTEEDPASAYGSLFSNGAEVFDYRKNTAIYNYDLHPIRHM
jgi:hypothetical protein